MIPWMRLLLIALMAFPVVTAPVAAQSSAATRLEALVDDYAARRAFSGTVPIQRDGEMVERASYGIGNVATGRQPDPALPSARAALADLRGPKP
ncbi:hypothetical protein [Sphingomonas pokkalii]|uniref:hypothetical protein n=1 Tax=Sphingomonas pokkalii TaxID=2175090 RepID=UPI0014024F90|nr:hypothetical protein [Sphingomonas pokkalii]